MTTNGPNVVFAFDKFRGTAGSSELAAVGAEQAAAAGWTASTVALADGGEGSLDVIGGPNRSTTVVGPLGHPVDAGWRLEKGRAWIEMAAASGLGLVGGAENNDPLRADTTGTGQLIAAAMEHGASEIVVFLGGSATTDGGLGAVEALPSIARLRSVDLTVAVDVSTRFVDAATVFAPQKGAGPAEVKLLTRRLERLVDVYRERFGVDVSERPGAGAAGGLAGGLMAVGGDLVPGFEILADHVRLDDLLAEADLVITGEGLFDEQSLNGKVVGGVADWAAEVGVPVVAIVGRVDPGSAELDLPAGLTVRSLADTYGLERAMIETGSLVAREVADVLAALDPTDG